MKIPRAIGHRYRMARRRRLAAEDGDICWWCKHPGADQVDHVVPRSVDPMRDVADITNMAPIHGTRGCPYCPQARGKRRKCNQERGRRLAAPASGTHSSDW